MSDQIPGGGLSVPSPEVVRRARVAPALFHLAERHAASDAARDRQVMAHLAGPHEVVRLVALLAGGSAEYLPGEPVVDPSDLTAVLTLLPVVRGEIDELEIAVVEMARGRGMTWAEVAYGLGLGSAQAAQQRHDRLSARHDDADED